MNDNPPIPTAGHGGRFIPCLPFAASLPLRGFPCERASHPKRNQQEYTHRDGFDGSFSFHFPRASTSAFCKEIFRKLRSALYGFLSLRLAHGLHRGCHAPDVCCCSHSDIFRLSLPHQTQCRTRRERQREGRLLLKSGFIGRVPPHRRSPEEFQPPRRSGRCPCPCDGSA